MTTTPLTSDERARLRALAQGDPYGAIRLAAPKLLALLDALDEEDDPIPMILRCPRCHQQHIDVGEFATRRHRTHRCTGEAGNGPGCGYEWRPAPVYTVGIKDEVGGLMGNLEAPAPVAEPGPLEARVQAFLAVAEKATEGPWAYRELTDIDTWECRSPDLKQITAEGEGCYLPEQEQANGLFVAAARNDAPALVRDLHARAEAAEAEAAALRRALIVDHYSSTSADSPRYWSCRVCGWMWSDGKPESHEPKCAIAAAPAPTDKAGGQE